MPRMAPRLAHKGAYAVAAILLLGWSLGSPARGAAETLWKRHAEEVPHWGDRTATIAAALRPRLEGRQDLLVVSRMLGLYRETGMRPPTRFPFVLHLWSGYAPVDGVAELDRMLAAKPGFVVVDDLWLPGGPRENAGQVALLDRLNAALAREYVVDGHTGRFASRGGGFVGGGIGATVFRQADRPARSPGGDGLVYAAAP
jgi:hypothetical protein